MDFQLPNPFSSKAPSEKGSLSRQQELTTAICDLAIITGVPLLLVLVAVTLLFPSTGMMIATGMIMLSLPLSYLSRRIAAGGNPVGAMFFLLVGFMLIISINSTIVEGFFSIMVPAIMLLIIMSGLVLGAKESIILAFIASLIYLIARLIHEFQALETSPLPPFAATIITVIVVFMTFLVAALFMYFMTNDLRKALTEATYELTEANIRLEEASEMKSQFTARTSHELRTPLSAIIVFTDLALRDAYGPLNERLRNGLEHVITSARHLKSIIDDILDLSKIEAGELEIEHEAFRLEEAVRTVEGVCEETVVDKNLEYSVWVSPEMPRYIFGDRHRITQIMLNLTSNAIKFTEQGEIKVRIEPVNRRAWTIVVSDTGPGIPEDQLERIFQAYRQLDHSKRGQSYKGTGLGLAIARNLAQLMGGSLVVGSDLGKGTTFTVTLPLEVAEELSSIPEPLP